MTPSYTGRGQPIGDLEVARAMLCLKIQLAQLQCTPVVVGRLIHDHLDQLLPDRLRDFFGRPDNNWEAILDRAYAFEFFATDLTQSEQYRERLRSLSIAVMDLYKSSAESRRIFDPSTFPHESLFVLRVCEALRIPFPRGIVDEGLAFLFAFCMHCYRPAIPGMRLCSVHSPKRVRRELNVSLAATISDVKDDYWFGRRLLPSLRDELQELMAWDWKMLQRTNGKGRILFPKKGIDSWLEFMRPKTRAALCSSLTRPTDDEWRRRLIDVYLEYVDDETGVRRRVDAFVKRQPHFLSPMVIRLEAWLAALELRRQRRGGNRGAFESTGLS